MKEPPLILCFIRSYSFQSFANNGTVVERAFDLEIDSSNYPNLLFSIVMFLLFAPNLPFLSPNMPFV